MGTIKLGRVKEKLFAFRNEVDSGFNGGESLLVGDSGSTPSWWSEIMAVSMHPNIQVHSGGPTEHQETKSCLANLDFERCTAKVYT